jgi:hypothetical protein
MEDDRDVRTLRMSAWERQGGISIEACFEFRKTEAMQCCCVAARNYSARGVICW